jgi:hypothetical protein
VVCGPAGARGSWPDPPARWLHSAFVQCVLWRESRDGQASSNLFQFTDQAWRSVGGAGSAGAASRAEQQWRAWRLYEALGAAPWRPFDGC